MDTVFNVVNSVTSAFADLVHQPRKSSSPPWLRQEEIAQEKKTDALDVATLIGAMALSSVGAHDEVRDLAEMRGMYKDEEMRNLAKLKRERRAREQKAKESAKREQRTHESPLDRELRTLQRENLALERKIYGRSKAPWDNDSDSD